MEHTFYFCQYVFTVLYYGELSIILNQVPKKTTNRFYEWKNKIGKDYDIWRNHTYVFKNVVES